MKLDITKISKTELLGKVISDYLKRFDGLAIFYLDGDLGTGKTTLVREILKSMGWSGSVKSPTFSILEEYHINGVNIYHSDLYRLNNEADFEMLGLEINDKTKGIFFIEWPEKISKFNFGIEYFLELTVNKDYRSIKFDTKDDKFLDCIDRINVENPI